MFSAASFELKQNESSQLLSEQHLWLILEMAVSCRAETSLVQHRLVSRFLFHHSLLWKVTETFTPNTVQELPVWCNYLGAAWRAVQSRPGVDPLEGKPSHLWDSSVLPEHRVLTAAGADRGHWTPST